MEKYLILLFITLFLSANNVSPVSFPTLSGKIPILKEVDVLILGGSLSGVSAALSAKSLGADVLLVDDKGFLGEALTSSLEAYSYTPDEDETGRELFAFLQKRKAIKEGMFQPEELKIALEELCKEKDIPFLYWCRPVDVIIEKGRIKGVVFVSKGGLFLIKCKILIDATPFGQATAPFLLSPLSLPYIESIGFITLNEPVSSPPDSLLLWRNSPNGKEKLCRLLILRNGSLSPYELSNRAGELIETITNLYHPLATAPFTTIAPLRHPPTYSTLYLSDCFEGKKARSPIAKGKGIVFFMHSKKGVMQRESKEVEVNKGFFISRQIKNLIFTYGDKLPLQPGVAWLESLGISLKAGKMLGILSVLSIRKELPPSKISTKDLLKEVGEN